MAPAAAYRQSMVTTKAQLVTQVAALADAIAALPPDVLPGSPDGTKSPPAPSIVTSDGAVFTLGNGHVIVNGTPNLNTVAVSPYLIAVAGRCVFRGTDGWYIASPTGGPSTKTTDPTAGDPTPTQSLLWTGAAGTFPTNVTPELGAGGWGNGELETYTNSAQNAFCDGKGHLIIVAKPDKTSARLNTTQSLQIQPGSYFECRAVLPPNGWAAIWTIGTDALPPTKVPWPDNGELDVVEIDGGHAKTNAHTTNNVQSGWGYPGADTGPVDGKTEVAWGCYFDATVVKFYRDRKLTSQWTAQQAAARGAKWPFGQAVYVIVNIAIANGDTNFAGATATFGPILAWKDKLPALS